MTDVFISYSRKDQDFSHWLVRSFEHYQRDVWLDKDDILPTAQWLAEIYAGIEAANNFVFIITPDSVNSQVCGWEVAHAIKHNKRLIPVLRRDVNFKELEQLMADPGWEGMLPEHWRALADLNWIMFKPELDQNQAFWNLFQAIDMDIQYIKQHSSILVNALKWDADGRRVNDTLRGGTLKKAEQWITQSRGKDPQPTKLHHDYIKASRAATTRRVLVTSFASFFTIVALSIAGWIAYDQYQQAVVERIARERKELETWSLDMASKAQDAFENGNSGLSLNLALAAVGIENPPLATQQTLEELAYQRGTVAAFDSAKLGRFASDETSIFLAQGNSLVHWDIINRSELNRFEMEAPILDFDVSPESILVFLALDDGSIRGLDLTSGSVRNYGSGRPPLALGSTTFVHLAENFLPVLRAVDTGDEIFRFVPDSDMDLYTSDLSYSEELDRLLVGLGNGQMYLWNTSSGELVSPLQWYEDSSVQVNAPPQDCLHAGTEVANVALSADGRYAVYAMRGGFPFSTFACQLNEILVWNLIDRKVVKHLIGHNLSGVESIAISPRGDTILSGGGNELFLWDVKTGKQLQQLPIFGYAVDSYTLVEDVSFSPSGRYAIVATDDRILRLLDLTPGMQLMRIELDFGNLSGTLIQAMALSPNGEFALAGGQGSARANPSTVMVNLNTGRKVSSFDYHDSVYDLAITPDSEFALEYSANGFFLIDIATGVDVHNFQDLEVGYLADDWASLRPFIALSPDGNTVFTQGCLFEVSSGERRSCFQFGERGLYNSEGTWIVSAVGSDTLIVWDPATGQELKRFPLEIDIGPLFALSPDNGELLVGSESDLVLINLFTGQPVRSFTGHTGPVYAGDLSPDGRLVISGSTDSTFRIWDKDVGIELRREQLGEWVFNTIFSADGKTAISGDHAGNLVHWRIPPSLDQLVDWIMQNRELPEMSCYEKDVYGITPLCDSSEYAWLGLTAITQMSNVVVESVEPNSPAEQAGLEIGDIVREINGNYIQSADQVYKIIEKYRPGDTISLKGYRSSSGEVFETNVALGQRP